MKIDHLGVAVRSLDQALGIWRDALGLPEGGREEVAGEKVRVAFLPLGETRLELLEATEPDSAIQRFIDKRGEGLHHICLEVPDLDEAMERARQKGLRLVGEGARSGAGGARVAFVHPGSCSGVLLELRQAP